MRDVEPSASEPPLALRRAQEARLREAWKVPSGWRYWSEVNNTEVGLWYTATAFLFFLFAGVLALLMRAQLAVPGNDLLSAETYNQVFTVHGSVMMFLFAIPVFESIAVIFLPQMLGARDLPFPRLSAFGYWCYLIGGLFLAGSIFFDAAPRGGWFMYPPLTSSYQPGIGADIWLLGFSFIEIAAIAAAVELIVGVLKCRPPGMRLNLMPLYAWYVLVAAIMVLFAFPPLIAGSMLLELERAFGWPFFDAARGGDPLLWQHLFWLFGHPEVYIIFLPSVALLAMIVPTLARHPIVGYTWIVLSAVGTGFVSFALWVHHMYTTGMPGVSLALFSAASEAVAIPTGVQLFCLIATVAAGRRMKATAPALFALGGMAIFVVGGLTGVMLAIAPFDFQAHDTFFVVAHFHYVLIGGALFPIAAGLYYYYPLIDGRRLSEARGRLAFWLMFTGFNVTFWPMHLAGLRGMPRRVFTYPAGLGFDVPNLIASAGAFVLAAGVAVVVWDVLRSRRGPVAERNPWGAGTLEWLPALPPETWGVRSIPEIDSRYPLWQQPDFERDVDQGRFYLSDAAESRRETIVTSVIDARPVQCLRLGGPTFITHWAALTVGGFFVLGTFKLWLAAALSLAAGVLVICRWLWTGSSLIPEAEEKDVGLGLKLPLYASGPSSVGWWAMFITMLAVITAFVCLVFGYFFYWTVREDFPPAGVAGPGTFWPCLGAALLAASWALTLLTIRANRRGSARAFFACLGAAALLALAGGLAMLAGPWRAGMDPTAHVYPATVWTLSAWTALHALAGVIMQAYCLAGRWAGRLTPRYDGDLHNVAVFWHFAALTAVVTAAVLAGFPRLA